MNAARRRLNPTVVLFCFSFLTAATYLLTRTLGVSLFMARVGGAALPQVLGVSAVFVIAISMLTRLVVRFVPSQFCVTLSWAVLAAVTFLLAIQVVAMPESLIVVGSIYVLAEVRGCLNTVFVTTLANDSFSSSRSKHPFVMIAAGAPVAGIVFGFFATYEASEIADTTWLSVIACLDILTVIASSFLDSPPKSESTKRLLRKPFSPVESVTTGVSETTGESATPSQASVPDQAAATGKAKPALIGRLTDGRRIKKNWRRYRFGLASLVAVKVAVLTLVGYQWQIVASDYLVSEENMIAYFAAFYAINDVLIVLIQALASGKILDRYGIGAPLMLYPMTLALVGIAAALGHSPWALMLVFTVGSGLNVLRRSVHDPGLAAAYAILNPSVRSETIVLVKGMIKPFVEVVVAVGLLRYASEVSINALTPVWVGLLLPWYFVARWVSHRYESVRTLRSAKAGA